MTGAADFFLAFAGKLDTLLSKGASAEEDEHAGLLCHFVA